MLIVRQWFSYQFVLEAHQMNNSILWYSTTSIMAVWILPSKQRWLAIHKCKRAQYDKGGFYAESQFSFQEKNVFVARAGDGVLGWMKLALFLHLDFHQNFHYLQSAGPCALKLHGCMYAMPRAAIHLYCLILPPPSNTCHRLEVPVRLDAII